MEISRYEKKHRLVLFPLPFQGHISPMLQLATILHSNGPFSITILHTNLNSPNPSNYPHFTFVSISETLSESEANEKDLGILFSTLIEKCRVPFRECLSGLLAEVEEEEPIACLITDWIWHFAQGIADELKVPRLVLRTSSASSFVAFAAFPIFLEKGYLPIQESQLEEPIPECQPLKIKDIPLIRTRIPEYFYAMLAAMNRETKLSKGLIFNSFEDLENHAISQTRHQFPIPIFPIGPFHKYFPASRSSLLTHDQTSISWLNKQAPNSVLYVSFGSVATIEPTEFLEIAYGLANSNQPFLWVVRPGFINGSEWVEPFLPTRFLEELNGRGHIVKWAPQPQVLAHDSVGGFWTHAGWNSTLESTCEGVPMICSPCLGDQHVNSRYVSDVWKIGLRFENELRREEIAIAIRRLMVEQEGVVIKERIMEMKHKVELSSRPGGSSYEFLKSLISYILSF